MIIARNTNTNYVSNPNYIEKLNFSVNRFWDKKEFISLYITEKISDEQYLYIKNKIFFYLFKDLNLKETNVINPSGLYLFKHIEREAIGISQGQYQFIRIRDWSFTFEDGLISELFTNKLYKFYSVDNHTLLTNIDEVYKYISKINNNLLKIETKLNIKILNKIKDYIINDFAQTYVDSNNINNSANLIIPMKEVLMINNIINNYNYPTFGWSLRIKVRKEIVNVFFINDFEYATHPHLRKQENSVYIPCTNGRPQLVGITPCVSLIIDDYKKTKNLKEDNLLTFISYVYQYKNFLQEESYHGVPYYKLIIKTRDCIYYNTKTSINNTYIENINLENILSILGVDLIYFIEEFLIVKNYKNEQIIVDLVLGNTLKLKNLELDYSKIVSFIETKYINGGIDKKYIDALLCYQVSLKEFEVVISNVIDNEGEDFERVLAKESLVDINSIFYTDKEKFIQKVDNLKFSKHPNIKGFDYVPDDIDNFITFKLFLNVKLVTVINDLIATLKTKYPNNTLNLEENEQLSGYPPEPIPF